MPGTSLYMASDVSIANTLYIFPTWFTGFLPAVASRDMYLQGVIRP